MLLLTAVTCSGWLSPPPAAIPETGWLCWGASSSILTVARDAKTGLSLTGFTVTENVLTVLTLSLLLERSPSKPPSVTVTVIVAVPD